LRRCRRHGNDRDADAVAPGVLLQILDVVNRYAATRLLPHLVLDVVEERGDLEPFLPKARVIGKRQPEVSGADDRHAQLAIETEDLLQVPAQIAHVIADPAHAELAEVREILANL